VWKGHVHQNKKGWWLLYKLFWVSGVSKGDVVAKGDRVFVGEQESLPTATLQISDS
jgi:hypothetical protein